MKWQPLDDSQKELTHNCISGMSFIRRRGPKTWLGLKTEEHYEDSLTAGRTATEGWFNIREIKPSGGGGGREEVSGESHEQRKVSGFCKFSGLGRSFIPCDSVWDSCGDLNENGPIGSYREAQLGDVLLLEKCVLGWD